MVLTHSFHGHLGSTSCLLWMTLLWPRLYKDLSESLLSTPRGAHPGVDLPDPLAMLCLIFWGAAMLFFTVVSTSHLTSRAQAPVSCPRQICFFLHYDSSHPNECEMLSHCVFDLHFPSDSWRWASIYELICPLYIFFGNLPAPALCLFALALLGPSSILPSTYFGVLWVNDYSGLGFMPLGLLDIRDRKSEYVTWYFGG